MTHNHDRATLETVELPEHKDEQNDFWVGDDQHWLQAQQDNAWQLVSIRGSRGVRGVAFGRRDDGSFLVFDDQQGPVPAGTDWRAIVRRDL